MRVLFQESGFALDIYKGYDSSEEGSPVRGITFQVGDADNTCDVEIDFKNETCMISINNNFEQLFKDKAIEHDGIAIYNYPT